MHGGVGGGIEHDAPRRNWALQANLRQLFTPRFADRLQLIPFLGQFGQQNVVKSLFSAVRELDPSPVIHAARSR